MSGCLGDEVSSRVVSRYGGECVNGLFWAQDEAVRNAQNGCACVAEPSGAVKT